MRPVFFSVLAGLLGASASLAIACGPAGAHVFLVDSYPSTKQRVATPPNVIKLRFSGRADAHYSTVSITSEDGAVLATRAQQNASRDLHLPAPPLQPGRYRVHYRILSTDGDLVEGKIEFVVGE